MRTPVSIVSFIGAASSLLCPDQLTRIEQIQRLVSSYEGVECLWHHSKSIKSMPATPILSLPLKMDLTAIRVAGERIFTRGLPCVQNGKELNHGQVSTFHTPFAHGRVQGQVVFSEDHASSRGYSTTTAKVSSSEYTLVFSDEVCSVDPLGGQLKEGDVVEEIRKVDTLEGFPFMISRLGLAEFLADSSVSTELPEDSEWSSMGDLGWLIHFEGPLTPEAMSLLPAELWEAEVSEDDGSCIEVEVETQSHNNASKGGSHLRKPDSRTVKKLFSIEPMRRRLKARKLLESVHPITAEEDRANVPTVTVDEDEPSSSTQTTTTTTKFNPFAAHLRTTTTTTLPGLLLPVFSQVFQGLGNGLKEVTSTIPVLNEWANLGYSASNTLLKSGELLADLSQMAAAQQGMLSSPQEAGVSLSGFLNSATIQLTGLNHIAAGFPEVQNMVSLGTKIILDNTLSTLGSVASLTGGFGGFAGGLGSSTGTTREVDERAIHWATLRNGVKIRYHIEGNGPAKVVSTARGQNSLDKDDVSRALDQVSNDWRSKITLLTWDRRNTGYSSVRFDVSEQNTVEAQLQAEDLLELMQLINHFPAVLVGESAGSRLSLHAARQRPDFVRGLVLRDPTAGVTAADVLASTYYSQYVNSAALLGMGAVMRTSHFAQLIQNNKDNESRLSKTDPLVFVQHMNTNANFLKETSNGPVLGFRDSQDLSFATMPAIVIHMQSPADGIHTDIAVNNLHNSLKNTVAGPFWGSSIDKDTWKKSMYDFIVFVS